VDGGDEERAEVELEQLQTRREVEERRAETMGN
jgi:hypothetical protein